MKLITEISNCSATLHTCQALSFLCGMHIIQIFPLYQKISRNATKFYKILKTKQFVDSRDVAVGFYEKLGYKADFNRVIEGETFTCVYMEKCLEME